MKHVIATTEVYREYDYFKAHPLEYLESSSDECWCNDDDMIIIGMLQSIKDEDVWEHAEFLTRLYFEDEIVNLEDAKLKNPIVATGSVTTWRGTFDIEPHKIECESISDILKYCASKFEDEFTIYDEDGTLYAEAYGHDNPTHPHRIYFKMLNDIGAELWDACEDGAPTNEYLAEYQSEDIGHLVQKIYGYKY